MQGPMRWRHALADTTNFDRGLGPADGDPVLDLTALRQVAPYGIVAMACVAGHNDRLLASTSVVPPADPRAAAELLAAGFDFVVREYLCPVVGGAPLPLPPRPAVAGSLAYGPLAGGRRRLPAVPCPLQPLRPVHDAAEAEAVVERCAGELAGQARADRIGLVIEALRALADNRRRHAGAFDAMVAAAVVEDARRGPCVELAVGDCGVGVRAAVIDGAGSEGDGAGSEGDGAASVEPVDDAAAVDLVLSRSSGMVATLARRLATLDGTLTVRSGTARHTVCATGVVRATVPFLRGTVVALTVPTGVPRLSAPPARQDAKVGSLELDCRRTVSGGLRSS